MFPSSNSVAMIALKRAAWDLTNAAAALFEERSLLMQLAAESNEFQSLDQEEMNNPDVDSNEMSEDSTTRMSTILSSNPAYLDILFGYSSLFYLNYRNHPEY